MPPVQHLNFPPHPFWDFVRELDNKTNGHQDSHGPGPQPGQSNSEGNGNGTHQQPAAEDPPEIDPATVRPQESRDIPFRDRHHEGRYGGRCGRSRDGFGPFGPPPFAFGGRPGPFWARRGPCSPPGAHGPPPPPPEGPGPHGGPGFEHRGRGGRGWHSHRGGPHGHRYHGGPPHHHHHGPPPPPEFNVGEFLTNLGERIGMDLRGATEGLGLERFINPDVASETDFEPKVDIFDQPTQYTIHVSLPGAKKDDVGVDWDGERSVLRVAGVVHRPDVDETMLSQLVVDGRKREVGVFGKDIRLGTKRDPASIDVGAIKARLQDGILVIRVPKVEVQHQKRDVPISNSESPSPSPEPTRQNNTLFDADNEVDMSDATIEAETPAPTSAEKGKEKTTGHQPEANDEKQPLPQSHAPHLDYEQDILPVYSAEETNQESDWEKYSDDSDEEGEFVKINVD